MENQTKALFAGLGQQYNEARATTGGQVWPKDGDHSCVVVAMHAELDSLRQDGQEDIPCASVWFEYDVINDPTRAQPLRFNGRRMRIPGNWSQVQEANVWKVEKDFGRLKGFCATILGREGVSPVDDLDELEGVINEQEVVCKVRVTSKDGEYKTDWCHELHQGPANE